MNPYLLAATIIAVAGQCSDAWTTYYGIFVKKVATEGDMNWFTQWQAGNKWRMLLTKPLLATGLAFTINKVFTGVVYAEVFGFVICAALAYSGISAGIHNYKINSAAK